MQGKAKHCNARSSNPKQLPCDAQPERGSTRLCLSGGCGLCCCEICRCWVAAAPSASLSLGRCKCCTLLLICCAAEGLLCSDVEVTSCEDVPAAERGDWSATVLLRTSVKPCAAISSLVSSSMVLSSCSSEQCTCVSQ